MVHWHSAKTACLGKIWFSSYSQRWHSANDIPVFFNRQYFINRLIDLACRYTWMKGTILINRFYEKKKNLIWANRPF